MKFKKPSGQKVTDTIALTGGVLVGGALSKGLFGVIHDSTVKEDPAEQKKQENTAMLKRGGIALASGVASIFIDGNDTVATLVKGALAGVAVIQSLEVVKTLASRSGMTPASQTTGLKRFAGNVVGLGCPCDAAPAASGLGYLPAVSPRYELFAEAPANSGLGINGLSASGNMLNDWASEGLRFSA